MGVYMDDLLLVAPDNILNEALQALKEKFTLATPEWVTKEHTVTFCGYEISKTEDGYALGQGMYIRDLLDKHNISQTAAVPCPKIEEGEEEPVGNLSGPTLRGAWGTDVVNQANSTRHCLHGGCHVKVAAQTACLCERHRQTVPQIPPCQCGQKTPLQR